MRLVVAIIFIVAACGGTADGPSQTASAASAKWLEFTGHVAVSAREVSSIFAEWAGIDLKTEAAAYDAKALELQSWAESESEWLKAHPFDSCYAGTYASWWSSVIIARDYARRIHEGIAEGDQTKLKQAGQTPAIAEMKKTSDSFPTSAAACAT